MSAPHLPGFTFVEHLGSGGFADVFLYEQEWPRQRVAVKVVRPDVPLTDREKSLFAAEANAMARLADHPYIVSVITAGITEEGGRPFLVMRYCPPPDLGVRVRANPMAPAEAIATGIKLASAIETAHRSGILHRDIKPSNVLVTTYHEPALTDFGIAGHIQDVEGDNDVRISYPWSPPEMLDGRSNGSVASDVYSLGATIWHLLVGRSPFSVPNGDNSTRALSARILHAAPPATQRPDVPPALDRLLQQCLAKNPDHRPRTALDLARALQRIEADAGFSRTPVAVEGDRSDEAVSLPRPAPVAPDLPGSTPPPAGAADEDHTVMKPVTVLTAGPRPSEPRRATTPHDEPDADEEQQERRGPAATVGAVVAVLLLVGVVAGLLLRDEPERDDPLPPPPPPTLLVGLDQPTVRAERGPEGVTFSWSVPGGPSRGDRWRLYLVERDEYRTMRKTSLLLRTPERSCLTVTLERGDQASPPGRECG
ncbi:serine/threonine-protein kinase [Nocardioides solisilvae]|uniref:serine/threonine-protein kinase n=1 Tax=Nocardioides solisilvae TaxID=1542435 RepID=UPI000D74415D|nr:protein kinase [Nocardioides solisilvae]